MIESKKKKKTRVPFSPQPPQHLFFVELFIYTMEYYAAEGKKELLPFATA